jgi:hypothetical protein
MKRLVSFSALLAGMLLAACGPHFDQESADHFTALKEYHLNFIDRFTGTGGGTYDDAAVKNACAQGTRDFETAQAYMESKRDKKRLKALATLRAEFEKDCRFLQDIEKLYSPSYATAHKSALGANYDHAIAEKYAQVEELDE